jgi:heat-inducible transcriptional repressor
VLKRKVVLSVDDRKLKILAAVVDEYVRTGEPVGSKAVAGLAHINVSAATIRNDMAALEQMGYLEQPHTSAGRVPTFLGYRLYIDELMSPPELSSDEKKRLDDMLGDGDTMTEELLMQNAATALAELTQCTAVVTNAAPRFSVISKVEVIPTGKRLYVILMITSSGNIKNKACRLEFDLTGEQLEYFTHYIEENLSGVSVESLSEETFEKMVTAMSAYMMTLSPLIKGIHDLSEDFRRQDITMSGEEKLLSCGELDTHEVVRFIEHKRELTNMLEDTFSGIQVKFGADGSSFAIGNSSLIVSKYRKGSRDAGSLGVIGPMRVDYKKIIPYIEYLTQRMSAIMTDDDENNDSGIKSLT